MRNVVKEFANLMESVLKKNDRKGGWRDESYGYLFTRLVEEVGELGREIDEDQPIALANTKAREILYKECADVANFAMMIADNIKNQLR